MKPLTYRYTFDVRSLPNTWRDRPTCRDVGHTWGFRARPKRWRMWLKRPEICHRCGTRRYVVKTR